MWEALSERTRLVWFETPTNPLLKVVDIAAAAGVLRERFGDGPRPLLVVDNTFASPVLQRPLDLGADIVFHSATKYLAGHSDTVLGVAVTRDPDVAERLRFLQNAMGGVPGPFDCFLALRGLRTLPLRVGRHNANASEVARFLAERDDIEWLSYPGLANGRARPPAGGLRGAPDARRRRDGLVRAGGERGGRSARDRAIAICESTRIFTLAESLGGVESLIELPAAMTHASVAGSTARGPRGAGPPLGRHRGRGRPHRRPPPGARPELIAASIARPSAGGLQRADMTIGRFRAATPVLLFAATYDCGSRLPRRPSGRCHARPVGSKHGARNGPRIAREPEQETDADMTVTQPSTEPPSTRSPRGGAAASARARSSPTSRPPRCTRRPFATARG